MITKAKALRSGLPVSETFKEMKRSLLIMVLVLIKIINSFGVNVDQKTVVVTLLELSLDGELIKNLL